MPFVKRYKLASDYAKKDTTGRLTMVPNFLVKTKQDIDNLLAQNLANGYEGVMIRDPKSVYQDADPTSFRNTRSSMTRSSRSSVSRRVKATTSAPSSGSARPRRARRSPFDPWEPVPRSRRCSRTLPITSRDAHLKFQDYTVAGIRDSLSGDLPRLRVKL